MVSLFTNFGAPGVQVIERELGYRNLTAQDFNAIYMFGTASSGAYVTPTLCSTVNNFTNQFPGSLSLNYVKAAFDQNAATELYFVRVGIAKTYLFTILNAIPTTINIVILGKTLTYEVIAPITIAAIVEDIIDLINSDIDISPQLVAYPGSTTDTFLLSAKIFGLDFTPSGLSSSVTATLQTYLAPTARDYVTAIQTAFDPNGNYRAGFLIAPQAYVNLGTAIDRQKVTVALENLANDLDWVVLVDTPDSISLPSALLNERSSLSSPKGHSWYYANSAYDLNDNLIPASVYVASIGTRIFREVGIKKSVAGIAWTLQNVTRINHEYDRTTQAVLADNQINILKKFDNVGIVIWDILTLSTNPNYSQSQGRVIMNVINNTLRAIPGVYSQVFEPIDDKGIFMLTLRGIIISLLRRFWQSGALFGNTENDAFQVVCDFDNNPLDQLDNGDVLAEVYAATTPNARRILINTVKVPIGNVNAAVIGGEFI